MDREGTSRVSQSESGPGTGEEDSKKMAEFQTPKEEVHVEKPKKERQRQEKEKKEVVPQEEPIDTDDEEYQSELAGARVFSDSLWKRLNTEMPDESFNIDHMEVKMDGEILSLKIVTGKEVCESYFSPRTAEDFRLRKNTWIPREGNTFKAFRTRLYSLPKTTKIHRITFYNTLNCEAEDCFIEFMFMKKWQCKTFEYNICQEFYQPEHLRKLIHMFKPVDIIIFLNFGPYVSPAHGPEQQGTHNHLAAVADGGVSLERDFRADCAQAMNNETNKALKELYSEAGRGKAFGMQMIRTLVSLRKFVSMMVEKRMAQTKGMNVKKFIIKTIANCPQTRNVGVVSEKICSKMQSLLKDDGPEEATKKRAAYAAGDKVFVCVRNDILRRAYKYTLAMPATAFKMHIGNDQFLYYTRSIMNFQCLFRTTVDETGVKQFITEWLKGDRTIDEIQLHVDKVFESDFCASFNPDTSDPKRFKIRRVDRRSTMYIERDRLATRHLSIRVFDSGK